VNVRRPGLDRRYQPVGDIALPRSRPARSIRFPADWSRFASTRSTGKFAEILKSHKQLRSVLKLLLCYSPRCRWRPDPVTWQTFA